jgi:hypothetical protein
MVTSLPVVKLAVQYERITILHVKFYSQLHNKEAHLYQMYLPGSLLSTNLEIRCKPESILDAHSEASFVSESLT